MDPTFPSHIVELASVARRAFASVGGVDLARHAERDPSERIRAMEMLRDLGAPDLNPLDGADEAFAAVVLAREAGRVALPAPAAAMMCRSADRPVVLVDPAYPLVDHCDLLGCMVAVEVNGTAWEAQSDGPALASRIAPFVGPVKLSSVPDSDEVQVGRAATWAWILSASTLLGFVDGALELCLNHVRNRRQFGKRIGDFQGVQFQIADAVVARDGLAELAMFTVDRANSDAPGAGTDARTFRYAACESARSVLRTAQQLHGASGLADEFDISVLCRHAQAQLRLPFGSDRLLDHLVDEIRAEGYAALFAHGSPDARRDDS